MQDKRQGWLFVILSHLSELAPSILKVIAQVLVVEYALGFAIWYALADGLKDLLGTPLGADFLNVYAAGVMVWRGQPEGVYDWIAHRQIEQSVAGYAAPCFSWHYPPMFLAVATLVALVPSVGLRALSGGEFRGILRGDAPHRATDFMDVGCFPWRFYRYSSTARTALLPQPYSARVYWRLKNSLGWRGLYSDFCRISRNFLW